MINLKGKHVTRNPEKPEDVVILEFIPLPVEEIQRLSKRELDSDGSTCIDTGGFFLAYPYPVKKDDGGVPIIDRIETFYFIE
jgi:hypothetical protein